LVPFSLGNFTTPTVVVSFVFFFFLGKTNFLFMVHSDCCTLHVFCYCSESMLSMSMSMSMTLLDAKVYDEVTWC
jgi:hypothetical protein